MKCMNCGNHVSIEKETSCAVCGISFPVKCSSCKEGNTLFSRYCWNCGVALDNNEQNRVSDYDKLSEARKKVAVMFADISGFTALSERLDPEEVRDIINECFSYITKPVYELEGTIDKYIGDCVMILFGAKYSHTDDAKRAVECGLKLMERIREYSEQKLYDKGFELNLSIGINYGVVVTGKVGNLYDKDFTVIGDIVNTAQRLQAAAGGGNLLVSSECYAQTRDFIEYSEMREIKVKNKELPVKSYQAIRVKNNSIDHSNILVGRDVELDAMNRIYRNQEGDRYITVVGEQGIGKTSLVKHFCNHYVDSSLKKLWINCSVMNRNKVYGVLSSLIFRLAGIQSSESMRTKSIELKSYIGYLLKDLSEEETRKNYDFLSLVSGLERSEEFNRVLRAMEYKDISRETEEQVKLFMSRVFMLHKLVLVFDDVQWADSASITFLRKNICVGMPGESIIMLLSQSEINEFMDQSNSVRLESLCEDGIRALAVKLFQADSLDDHLMKSMIDFSHGNPLFVKEYAYAILRKNRFNVCDGCFSMNDSKVVQSIPSTIESAILSNLSDLNEEYMTALQVAACIGKEFRFTQVMDILQRFVDESQFVDKLKNLNVLSLKEVVASSEMVEKIYMFNQDLTRKVILDGILNKDKTKYYKGLAELVEREFEKEIEYHYTELQAYYEAAKMEQKSREYAYKAAVKLKSDFKYTSALEYFLIFIRLTAGKKDEKNMSMIAEAYTDMGSVNMILGNMEEALRYFNKVLELELGLEDKQAVMLMIADIYRGKGEFENALKIIEEVEARTRSNSSIYGRVLKLKCTIMKMQGKADVLNIALESEDILAKTRDYESLSETQSMIGLIYFFDGKIDDANFYLTKAYENAERISNLKLIAKVAGNLGVVYHSSGRTSKALEFFKRAAEISNKISSMQTYISSSMNLGKVYMEKGSFDKSEEYLRTALEKSRQMAAVYANVITLMNYGDLMYIRGDYKKSEALYHESLNLIDKYQITGEKAINYLNIAKLKLKTGEQEEADRMLNNAWTVFEKTKQTTDYSDYYRLRSIQSLGEECLDMAAALCNTAIQYALEANNDLKKLKAIRLKAIILTKKSEWSEALELLKEALKISELLESEYECAKTCYYLGKAYAALGHIENSKEHKRLAAEFIQKVDRCIWKSALIDE